MTHALPLYLLCDVTFQTLKKSGQSKLLSEPSARLTRMRLRDINHPIERTINKPAVLSATKERISRPTPSLKVRKTLKDYEVPRYSTRAKKTKVT